MKKRKFRGYWKDIENCFAESKKVMIEKKFDILPDADQLKEWGYSSLSNAINSYHGGFHKFRELLGQATLQVRGGLWKDLNYALEQAKKLMNEKDVDSLPSSGQLTKWGYASLALAISKYHGGYHAFRELLGQEQIQARSGIWQGLDYAIEQAKKAMRAEGWTKLPHADVLKERGYSSLSTAITTYHGGFPAFRKKLEQYLGRPSSKEQLEQILDEYLGEQP